MLGYTRAGFLDGDDWGGGDRPEGSDDDDDEEDQEEEDQAEDRPYARPITPALESRGRRFLRGLRREPSASPRACRATRPPRGVVVLDGTGTRGAFQGTTAPVV